MDKYQLMNFPHQAEMTGEALVNQQAGTPDWQPQAKQSISPGGGSQGKEQMTNSI